MSIAGNNYILTHTKPLEYHKELFESLVSPVVIEKNAWKNFPVTEHIHFYGMYIGNFPDLYLKEVDEIVNIINQAV